MELTLLTPPASSQLALLRRLRLDRRKEVAFKVFGDHDLLMIIMQSEVRQQYRHMTDTERYCAFILGFCSLFSACRAIRAQVSALKDGIQWLIDSCTTVKTDLVLMQRLTVGEHLMIFRNFRVWDRADSKIRFNAPECPVPNRIPDALRHAPGGQQMFMDYTAWVSPPTDVVRAFGDVLLKFQADGNLYPLCKFGFFSTSRNRRDVSLVIDCILNDRRAQNYLSDKERLEYLGDLLEHSYGIVNLTRGIVRMPGEEPFPYVSELTGIHVCLSLWHVTDARRVSFRSSSEFSWPHPTLGFTVDMPLTDLGHRLF